MKLHVYDHCPFCVKARAIFGLKALPVELVVMLNDDAASPERMVGRKVAPILERDGVFTPESMDIVAMVDAMSGPRVLVGPTDPGVGRWIAEGSDTLYRLAIPRWAAAPLAEFATAEARAFFKRKKEAMIGPLRREAGGDGRPHRGDGFPSRQVGAAGTLLGGGERHVVRG